MSIYFQINTAKIAQEIIDGEVIIINLDQGYYYSILNNGAEIWSGIERGLSRNEIITEILERYEGSPQEIEKGVDALIEQLQQEEIILLSSSNSQLNKSSSSEEKVTGNGQQKKLKFETPNLTKYTDMQDLLTLDPIHDVDETGWPNPKQV